MSSEEEQSFEDFERALKNSIAALRDADIPFLLGGSFAAWARGGPESDHDVDFIIKPGDADSALEILAGHGFRSEKPPEPWLYKVYDDNDALIDLIFAPNNKPVDDAMLERADELEVYAVKMRVMSTTDILVTKLLAMKEHEIDYDSVLEVARALREQVDWQDLRERVSVSPYAKAFLTLVEELELAPRP